MRRVVVSIGLALVAIPAAAQINENNGLALVKALRESQGSMAYSIVQANGPAVVNYRGPDGEAPLHVVTRLRNSNWVGYLLSNKADPNITDKDGDTPLIIAARMGYTDGAQRLLSARADLDRTNRRGETPLIVAVNQRQPGVVRLLLMAGADPDKRDFAQGYSAREYAKRDSRMPELLRLIETIKRPNRQVAGPVRR